MDSSHSVASASFLAHIGGVDPSPSCIKSIALAAVPRLDHCKTPWVNHDVVTIAERHPPALHQQQCLEKLADLYFFLTKSYVWLAHLHLEIQLTVTESTSPSNTLWQMQKRPCAADPRLARLPARSKAKLQRPSNFPASGQSTA